MENCDERRWRRDAENKLTDKNHRHYHCNCSSHRCIICLYHVCTDTNTWKLIMRRYYVDCVQCVHCDVRFLRIGHILKTENMKKNLNKISFYFSIFKFIYVLMLIRCSKYEKKTCKRTIFLRHFVLWVSLAGTSVWSIQRASVIFTLSFYVPT